MRLLLGSVFRKMSDVRLQTMSWILMFTGSIFLHAAGSYTIIIAGLLMLGAGLAGGFPVMLGILGKRFAGRSATAFSIALVIGLIGNMLINYLTGIIAGKYGIEKITTIMFVEFSVMLVLGFFIFNRKGIKDE